MWTSRLSSRRVQRFQRNKAFSISYLVWSYYLDIVDYFKGLSGVHVLWEERVNSATSAMGKEHYIWLTTRRHNFSKTLKRMWYFGRKIWGFLFVLFVFCWYVSYLGKIMPAVDKTKHREVPKKEWESKEPFAVPEWHLPYINNQLLQLRAQGKEVNEDLVKKFYHLPHSVTDEMENPSLDNTQKHDAESFKETRPNNQMNSKIPTEQKNKLMQDKAVPVSQHKKSSSSEPRNSKNGLKIPKTHIPVSPVPRTVIKSLKSLVDRYLEPFLGGISKEQYMEVLQRNTYAVTPKGANKGVSCVLIQIVDHEIYVLDPYQITISGKDLYKNRLEQALVLIQKLVEKKSLPNVEFVLSLHDCVQTVSKPHHYRVAKHIESRPIFTLIHCNFSDNLPFPMLEGSSHRGDWKSWDMSYSIPWTQKTDKAVFRGGIRDSSYFESREEAQRKCMDAGRGKLIQLQEKRQDLFNISVSGRCLKSYILKRLSFEQQVSSMTRILVAFDDANLKQHFKYNIYAEGNCFWADRLAKQLFASFVTIKQDTPCGLYFEPLLQPMTHYIPTDYFFNDLIEKIEWAQAHDAQVKQIMQQANQWASQYLSFSAVLTFCP
ncbi:lipopolysaccharide-modifying enzyme-like protein isoform 2 [Galdieria sulphuraria]|uniref:Lipopolysaccharide-modifying enzyme-like protein isoform 2 n=1 Tax=Galdieria sulphuraria TaxID=130081 RepID=M2XV67_GALSU|nr:lipopolysaccharide-modifying enzyme-like protein isoform 2 [Galdieria sulphuraria]EME27299.1 lipopolysaccharide-modifying enzyme-like protein isoform 2 [Galdieria sulphuraria]|eukprot:XP_005703819.1 lipopolysaccharide-modifying enzyme-like protein isoform 2 [Galdieria sulphuraria]